MTPPANDNKDLTWELDGPDEDGKVWLIYKSGKDGIHLGDYEAVFPYLQSWVDANKRGERDT